MRMVSLKKTPSRFFTFGSFFYASALISNAATLVIIDEQFTGGSQPSNTASVTWSDSDGGSFETYNSGGASPRDMFDNYDDDQNGGTPNVTIPGGIEVNDDVPAGGVTLTASITFTLPVGDTVTSSALTFFAGTRGTAGPAPSLTITNVTDGNSILLNAAPISINANDNIWEFNEFTGIFSDSDAGDTIEVDWFGGGNSSASGLQLADIDLTIETGAIPEPSGLALLGLGGFVILARRRR